MSSGLRGYGDPNLQLLSREADHVPRSEVDRVAVGVLTARKLDGPETVNTGDESFDRDAARGRFEH